MSTYSNIESHKGMVFDEVRNAAYERAIKNAVTSDSTVLDLGAGLGIHGLLAAALGAREVILIDPSRLVELGAEIARANGVSDRVKVIRARIEEAEIDSQVDVLISVFTGNFLLTEDLLPLLFSARDRFLKPGGVMLPGKARMQAALVTAEAFHHEHVTRWSEPALGLNYKPVQRFAANGIYYDTAKNIDAKLLCEPVILQEIDLLTAVTADCRCKVEMTVQASGRCHGVLGWFDILLGDYWISTAPDAEPMHWSLAFLPLDPPMEFQEGEQVTFELHRPEFGEWTWTVSCAGERQRHSTFHNKPADLNYLKKQMDGFVPGLGKQGEVALHVLQQMKRGKSMAEILERFCQDFPQLAQRDPGMKFRIKQMVTKWGKDEG